MRALFPRYYAWCTFLSLPAVALAFGPDATAAIALLAVAILFIVSRQVITPRINRASDRQLEGDREATGRSRRLHRVSVLINALQMPVLLFVAIRLV